MTYRRALPILAIVIGIAGGILALLYAPAKQSARPPNILLIVLDDFGYNDLRANGNSQSPTPNLDALAAQGTRYTRHYADATCSVARAALMTGRHPAVHGLRPNHLGLSPDTPTIATALRQAGYRTEHIGKWHIATATLQQSPLQAGFDNWFGFLHNQETSGPSNDGVTFRRPTHINPWLRDNLSPPRQYTGHLTDILTERAISFLDQQKGQSQPWFLNLWYFAPHSPIQPPDAVRKRYPDNPEGAYHALIDHLDANIGSLLKALDRNGQADETLVIVLSDNGGTNRETNNNHPFFGTKAQFLEGGVRTPMFMRWPGHIKPGVVTDELVSLYDIFPTIAQASAATLPPNVNGRSLLDPRRAAPAPLYWEYLDSIYQSYSVLSADGRWRYTQLYQKRSLNDLVADPTGTVNVLDQHPQIAAKLTEDYLRWRETARTVNFKYEPVNDRGGAILRGDDLQRSPGFSGFSFAIGVTPAEDANGSPQVIAEQAGRWKLQTNTDQGLQLDILGQTLTAPPLPAGECSEVVVSSQFNFALLTRSNWSIIDLYVNGERINTTRMERPALQTWGYANPTYLGINAQGGEPFAGHLSRPIILNERVVPDKPTEKIFNGISGVPRACAPSTGQPE